MCQGSFSRNSISGGARSGGSAGFNALATKEAKPDSQDKIKLHKNEKGASLSASEGLSHLVSAPGCSEPAVLRLLLRQSRPPPRRRYRSCTDLPLAKEVEFANPVWRWFCPSAHPLQQVLPEEAASLQHHSFAVLGTRGWPWYPHPEAALLLDGSSNIQDKQLPPTKRQRERVWRKERQRGAVVAWSQTPIPLPLRCLGQRSSWKWWSRAWGKQDLMRKGGVLIRLVFPSLSKPIAITNKIICSKSRLFGPWCSVVRDLPAQPAFRSSSLLSDLLRRSSRRASCQRSAYDCSPEVRISKTWQQRQGQTDKILRRRMKNRGLCKSQLPPSFTLGWSQEPHLTEARQDHLAARDPLASARISISRGWVLPAGTLGSEFGKGRYNLPYLLG